MEYVKKGVNVFNLIVVKNFLICNVKKEKLIIIQILIFRKKFFTKIFNSGKFYSFNRIYLCKKSHKKGRPAIVYNPNV